MLNIIIGAVVIIAAICGWLIYKRGWKEAKAEITVFVLAVGAAIAALFHGGVPGQ